MAEEQSDLFKKIGIDIEQDKIDIDLGKTKAFFTALQNMLQQKAEEVQQNLSQGKIDMEESAGIKVDEEHIRIDLEKTRNFIESLGKNIESFVGELDRTVEQTLNRFEKK
jgi:hypothetical protein